MPFGLANGQLAATAGTILAAFRDERIVHIALANTSASTSETVVVNVVRAGGTARRVARIVLAPNETARISHLALDAADVVTASTTNASTVDYDVSLTTAGTFEIVCYDANGALKSGSAALSGNLTATGDINALTSGGATFELWDASDVTTLWASSPSRASSQPGIVCEIEDDFTEYDPTASVGNWVLVEDDAACTQALSDDVAGGVLLLTNKATTDDNAQQVSYVSAPFLLAADKHLWFEARVKCGAGATQVDVIVGLCALGEDMTGVADNRFQDGIGFFKSDGATTVQFGSSKNGTDTGTNTNVGTMGTGWHTYGFYVNGLTSCTPYFDGVAGTPITATFCDDESLAPIFMVRNGDGTITNTLEIDRVLVRQLR